jgi:hypothetical protein
MSLAAPAERLYHLVEREDYVDVVWLATEAAGEPGECLAPAGAAEVALCILVGKAGVRQGPW